MSQFVEARDSSLPGTEWPSPALFFETMNAYQRTEGLKAAIELEVFTAIAEGHNTTETMSYRCAASERGLRILCDYLVVIGFLTKEGNRYALTPDSAAFLDANSPTYIGAATRFLGSPLATANFKNLVAAVRSGGAVADNGEYFNTDHPMWVDFARGMAGLMALPAELIAGMLGARSGQEWKVLDIAAGHGLFGITLAKHNPNAHVVAVDWPDVLAVACENARKTGVAARFGTIPGNAFEVDFGGGYDIVLVPNFLHHFDVPTCENLLIKIYASLRPGGRVVALDFVPNPDRVSPHVPAQFSLTMLANTAGGDTYTAAELESMFRNAGFSRTAVRALPPTFEHTIVAYKLTPVEPA